MKFPYKKLIKHSSICSRFESKMQVGLLGILLISIVNYVVGTFLPPSNEAISKGFIGYSRKHWFVIAGFIVG